MEENNDVFFRYQIYPQKYGNLWGFIEVLDLDQALLRSRAGPHDANRPLKSVTTVGSGVRMSCLPELLQSSSCFLYHYSIFAKSLAMRLAARVARHAKT